jgi:uncharacterized Zn-binding protein involved in type VI secretion
MMVGQPITLRGHMHVCPMVDPGPKPHFGGPVSSTAQSFVCVDGVPTATVGDKCTCTGVPTAAGITSGRRLPRSVAGRSLAWGRLRAWRAVGSGCALADFRLNSGFGQALDARGGDDAPGAGLLRPQHINDWALRFSYVPGQRAGALFSVGFAALPVWPIDGPQCRRSVTQWLAR